MNKRSRDCGERPRETISLYSQLKWHLRCFDSDWNEIPFFYATNDIFAITRKISEIRLNQFQLAVDCETGKFLEEKSLNWTLEVKP